MLEDPQPKQCFVYAKFAQNKSKTLCSLLVFTQLFRTRNKEQWQYFLLSSLTFLDHMYLYVPLAPISRGQITVPVPFLGLSLLPNPTEALAMLASTHLVSFLHDHLVGVEVAPSYTDCRFNSFAVFATFHFCFYSVFERKLKER